MSCGYSRRRAFEAVSKVIEVTMADYKRSGPRSRPGPLLQDNGFPAKSTLAALRKLDPEAAEDYVRYAKQTLRLLGREKEVHDISTEP